MRYGYTLLWALVFATIGTMILQEMSARLGVSGGIGLGEAMRRRFEGPERRVIRWLAVGLVTGAIGVGNAAYQTGNLLGASLGGQVVAGGGVRVWAAGVALTAAALLWTGRYRVIERALIAMVVVMSISFLATAISIATGPAEMLRGALVPVIPDGGAMVALGLVGTTIVPYNLFLHAAAARERWGAGGSLREARADSFVAIGLGGFVSMAIVVTAAARMGAPVSNAADMAVQLEPLLGRWAPAVFATGLLAAGVTSSITAPLAAAYALAGALGWSTELRGARMRGVWLAVLACGTAFALTGIRPVPAILFAQAANGILLPAIAIFLLVVMNDRAALGPAANGWKANLLGVSVVVLTFALGIRALAGALF